MPEAPHPLDHLTAPLVDVYTAQTRRLEQIVQAGLSRGLDPSGGKPGEATLAYRQRQLDQARAQLAQLADSTSKAVPVIAGRGYLATTLALDKTTGLTATFGNVHVGAINVLAAQLDEALQAAIQQTGQRVEDVFNIAAQLEGALPVGGRVAGVPFLGRRFNDQLRQVTLDAAAGALIAGDTRREVSRQLIQQLIREGVASATAGLVDRGGRRWALDRYAEMAARTTTREIMSTATVNRMGEHGLDLVTVSSHRHKADSCSPFDGKTFSLSGTDSRYPQLQVQPPFHPNCRHVLTPAGVNFEDFEKEVGATSGATTPPPPPPPPAPPAPPADVTPADLLPPLPSTDQIIEAGGKVIDRANEIAGPRRQELADQLDQAIKDFEVAKADTRIEAMADYIKAEVRIEQTNLELAALDRDSLLTALKEQRPGFGEGVLEVSGPDAGVKQLKAAARYLPREWVEASNTASKSLQVTVKDRVRAHYNSHAGTIQLSKGGSDSTALHELAHRMQYEGAPRLSEAEAEFYRRRITNPAGKVAKRERINHEPMMGGSATEVFRGAWTHPYIGRDYGLKTRVYESIDAKELSSMAAEGVFYGRHGIRTLDANAISLRNSYRQIINTIEQGEILDKMAAAEQGRKVRRKPALEAKLQRMRETVRMLDEGGDPDLARFFLGALATL